jgi:hypothetical protein
VRAATAPQYQPQPQAQVRKREGKGLAWRMQTSTTRWLGLTSTGALARTWITWQAAVGGAMAMLPPPARRYDDRSLRWDERLLHFMAEWDEDDFSTSWNRWLVGSLL